MREERGFGEENGEEKQQSYFDDVIGSREP